MAKQYRLIIQEEESHKSIRSFLVTDVGAYVISGSAFLFLIIIVFCIIAFTPIHYLIPGSMNAKERRTVLENAMRVDSLENTIARWEIYADNLGRVLTGESILNVDSLLRGNMTRYLSDLSAEQLRSRDSLLRSEVSEAERFVISGSSRKITTIDGMHFFAPVKGVLIKPFDPVNHPAVDITAKEGEVVCAVLDGTVIGTGWNEEDGYFMQIQHPSDIVTSFKHCRSLCVKKGEHVKAGAPVGMLGNVTSLSKGDYLHFELWCKGEAVDPLKYISF